MRTILGWIFSVLRFFRSRIFAVGLLTALMSVTVYATATTINTVYIHDDNLEETILIHTAVTDVSKILEAEGITVHPEDKVSFDDFQNNMAEIHIDRAFDVSITADGRTKEVWMTNGTVRDALALAEVTLGNEDLISISPSEFAQPGDEVVINRVAYRDTVVEEDIPYESTQKLTPLLRNGKTNTLQEGRTGVLHKTYTERTIDGVVEEATLIGQSIVKKPVEEITLVGADVPVSAYDFGYTIKNNAPTKYKKLLPNVRAAGYSAGASANGASGNELTYGHVAVNPAVIPYNSKLYITSPDGKFVYGYAIASDTGVALMQGIIGIDLYYDTYRESVLNSIRSVNVYILE